MMEEKNTNLVIYTTPTKDVTIPVQMDGDTVWLTQKQMAELFQKDRKTITEHIGNIFKEGELAKIQLSGISSILPRITR